MKKHIFALFVGLLTFNIFQPAVANDVVKLLAEIRQAQELRDPNHAALKAGIEHEKLVVRKAVARAFGLIQKAEGIDPLIQLAQKSKEKTLVSDSLFSLGQVALNFDIKGAPLEKIAKALSGFLKNPSVEIRLSAIEALGKIWTSGSVDTLKAGLLDSSSQIKAETLLALFRTSYVYRLQNGQYPAPVSDDLFKTMAALAADGSNDVRRDLIYYFARIKDERAVSLARGLSFDKDPEVQFFALTAANRLGAFSEPEALVSFLKHREPSVRIITVTLLKTLKKVDLIPESADADTDWHVRNAIVSALGSNTVYQKRLEGFLKDESLTVRSEALKVYAKLSTVNPADLLKVTLAQPDYRMRAAAVSVSELLGQEQEAFLISASKDKDVRVRTVVLEGLKNFASEAAFLVIKAATLSLDLSERNTALTVLKERKDAQVLDVAWDSYIKSLNDQNNQWLFARTTATEIMGETVSEFTTEKLKKMLKDPHASVGQLAKSYLEKRGIADLPNIPDAPYVYSPYLNLKVGSDPVVVFETSKGRIRVKLLRRDAPGHVSNIIGLVRKGHYDGATWHRVVSNFVVQGGSSDGTGWGDLGYNMRAEINRWPFIRGALGMPRGDSFDSGGNEIFINHLRTPHLDGFYTVFGYVISGQNVIDRIEMGDQIFKAYEQQREDKEVTPTPAPQEPVKIQAQAAGPASSI